MEAKIEKLAGEALEKIAKAQSKNILESIRIEYLGRKQGLVSNLSKQITLLPEIKRRGIGTKLKQARQKLDKALMQKAKEFEGAVSEFDEDLTTKGAKLKVGTFHPLTLVEEEVKEIFHHLGFSWADGPEVENDLYNFQKLNIPPDHPSRDIQQTFYISKDTLLRTHTSNMQVRYMEQNKPPIRVLFPGRAFRTDMPDSTHLPAFFQIEGLMVDNKLSMTDLLGTLDYFAKSFFGEKTKIRVYGHNFPYTEPSIEVEVSHPKKGWLEILGAGMVHPKVLESGGLDPKKYRGWAFGVGIERLAMIKYEIDDIRNFVINDIRFLEQF